MAYFNSIFLSFSFVKTSLIFTLIFYNFVEIKIAKIIKLVFSGSNDNLIEMERNILQVKQTLFFFDGRKESNNE